MTEEDIYDFLRQVFAKTFGRDDIDLKPKTSSNDVYGWDSFKHLDLIMLIEEDLEIRISAKEINSLQNVGDLVKVIKAHKV